MAPRRTDRPSSTNLFERSFRVVATNNNADVTLRITSSSIQGNRDYMEDRVSLGFVPADTDNTNGRNTVYTYIGVFDGHGGAEASSYAKKKLLRLISDEAGFWSQDDSTVLKAIRQGFLSLFNEMIDNCKSWPDTSSGYPSTAGTTASVAFIRNGKMYTGHVGDSRIVLGAQPKQSLSSSPPDKPWESIDLTEDHTPENEKERKRIERCGGQVAYRGSVARVVWLRPRLEDKSSRRRKSTPIIDEIPFLAVARSLGDFWSYNPVTNSYLVTPDPDLNVVKLDPELHRCLIFATDGIWHVIQSNEAVACVQEAENQARSLVSSVDSEGIRTLPSTLLNPSARLVNMAATRFAMKSIKADNISVITALLDFPTLANRVADAVDDPANDLDLASVNEIMTSEGRVSKPRRTLARQSCIETRAMKMKRGRVTRSMSKKKVKFVRPSWKDCYC